MCVLETYNRDIWQAKVGWKMGEVAWRVKCVCVYIFINMYLIKTRNGRRKKKSMLTKNTEEKKENKEIMCVRVF